MCEGKVIMLPILIAIVIFTVFVKGTYLRYQYLLFFMVLTAKRKLIPVSKILVCGISRNGFQVVKLSNLLLSQLRMY